MTERPAIDSMGYEQARDELAEVVRVLEAGGLSLDESVALWERGEALARRCEEQLAGARERIRQVLDTAVAEPTVGAQCGRSSSPDSAPPARAR